MQPPLARPLRNCARGFYPAEAVTVTELLINHTSWLHRIDFCATP